MKNTHKNIIANYIGKIWGVISIYLFIPLYIKLLGIEAYAIISFYTVMLTIMFIADAGLSATFSREVARTEDKVYLSNLLFTLERLYLIICVVVALLIMIFAPLIATHWLKSETIPKTELSHYITLMGISIALQLFTTLYNGGLMGLQKQVLANSIQVGYSLFRSGVVLIPIYFYPNLYVYFFWQIGINLITLIVTKFYIWRCIRTNIIPIFNLSLLKNIWKFAVGMMAMSLIASLNTQVDKILTTKYLTLTEFGYYSLASTLAQLPYIITLPIAIAILPQLTRLSEEKKIFELKTIFHKYSYLITGLAITIGLILLLYTKEIIYIWQQDAQIALDINEVTKILVIGGVFLALQYMPYYLSIANGHNLTNVKLGLASLCITIPFLIILIPRLGLVGAGIPWAVMNFILFMLLGSILIKKFLPQEFSTWFFKNTIKPMFICLFVGSLLFLLSLCLPKGYYTILYAAATFIFAMFTAIFANINLKNNIIRLLSSLKK